MTDMDAAWAQQIVAESRDRIAKADDRAARMRDAFERGTWDEFTKTVADEYGIDINSDGTDPDTANSDGASRSERADDSESDPRGSGESGPELPEAGGSAEPSP